MVRVPERAGELVPLHEEVVEDRHVLRVPAVQELPLEPPPDLRVLRVLEHREGIRVVRRDRDLAFLDGMGFDVVLREAFQEVRGGELDGPDVLVDVPVELRPD